MRAIVVLLALAAGLLSAVAIAWADGEPDTTFAEDGSAEIGLGTFRRVDRPAADVTPDGGLVAAIVSRQSGFCQDECSIGRGRVATEGLQLARLNADGTPFAGTPSDGWDSEGTAIFEEFAGQNEVEALRVLADGTILVVVDAGEIRLVRVRPDGTLASTQNAGTGCEDGGTLEKVIISKAGDRIDTVASCGGQGALRAFDGSLNPLPGREEATVVQNGRGFYVRDAAKDSEGRIVILGWDLDDNEHPTPDVDKALLLRYRPDGSRDTSLAVDVPGDGLSLAVDLEDRPIVSLATGARRYDFKRFTETGALDTTYGNGGVGSVENEDFLDVQATNSVSENLPHLLVQPDGKLLAVTRTRDYERMAVIRLLPGGQADATFDGDGVLILSGVPDHPITKVGAAVLDAVDGTIFVPGGSDHTGDSGEARAIEGDEAGLRIFGLKNTLPVPETKTETQTQTSTTTTTTATTPTPPQQIVPNERRPQTARTCRSRRSFSIRVRPSSRKLKSAKVRVAGKVAKVRRRSGRLVATVDLRKLKQATFTVSIDARDTKGRRYRETRRYRTCRVGEAGRPVKGGSIVVTVGG